MLSLLSLPRELFLEVCAYLLPYELAKLAAVSKDHYLSVQQPLYQRINLASYGSLVSLVHTLQRTPVVSYISPKQRLHWFKLSDAELRERDVRHLHLHLDSTKDGKHATGVILANCIGAITRKCHAVKIHLVLQGSWHDLRKQLANFGVTNAIELQLLSCHASRDEIWDVLLSGSTFPGLRALLRAKTRTISPHIS